MKQLAILSGLTRGLLCASSILLATTPLDAATRTWTGASVSDPAPSNRNNFWTNALNWSAKVAPAAGDDLVFPSTGVSQLTSINTFAAGTGFNSINIGNHLVSGGAIALNTGISATAGQVNVNAIKLNNSQTFALPISGTHLIASAIDTNGRTLTLQSEGTLALTGVVSGTGGVSKTGNGTAFLTGANSYTGRTFVRAGTLVINGAQAASDLFVDTHGTLAGGGTIGRLSSAITSNAPLQPCFVSPGSNGTAVLNVAGGLDMGNTTASATWVLQLDLNGTTAGSGYDQLNVTGVVNPGIFGSLELTLGSSFTPAPGDTFIIVKNDGTDAVTSTFRNLPEGGVVSVGTTNFVISYKGGDGNDITLHVVTTRTWSGGGADANWMTPENWVGNVAPQAGDSLEFPSGTPAKTNVNNFPEGTTFDVINFMDGGYDVSGNPLNVHTRLTHSGGTTTTIRLSVGGLGEVVIQRGGLTLRANNTYTGKTTLGPALLSVSGDQRSSPVVLTGGTLSIGGFVGPVTATSASNVQPGFNASRPTMGVLGDVTFIDVTKFLPTLADAPRTIQVTGTVHLGNARLIAVAAEPPPPVGSITTIIDNDAAEPIDGTFGGLPEGAVFQVTTDAHYRISYAGGDGNDVTLTRVESPTISIDDVTVTEGNTATTAAQFTVTMSFPVANAVVITVRTRDGTATSADADYVASARNVTIPAGATSQTVTFAVNGDTTVEPDETFLVDLTGVNTAAPARTTGTCTIINDDVETVPTPTPTATAQPTPSPTPTATPSNSPTVLANIATRLRVDAGDNALIGGFIITGTAAKRVVLRAIGPSLNLAGRLTNPTLELFDSAGRVVAFNDNWQDAPNRQEIIDTGIAPTNSLESVILTPLAPGNYTAVVRDKNEVSGIGVVEVYDLDTAVDAKLANIATRGVVHTGDEAMIGGFIVLGSNAQKVIIRALGPSLSVPGEKLANPTLELRNSDGAIVRADDDWRTGGQQPEIVAIGIPPTDDRESALVETLPPGAYTAIVRGVNDGTGIAVVEVYALN